MKKIVGITAIIGLIAGAFLALANPASATQTRNETIYDFTQGSSSCTSGNNYNTPKILSTITYNDQQKGTIRTAGSSIWHYPSSSATQNNFDYNCQRYQLMCYYPAYGGYQGWWAYSPGDSPCPLSPAPYDLTTAVTGGVVLDRLCNLDTSNFATGHVSPVNGDFNWEKVLRRMPADGRSPLSGKLVIFYYPDDYITEPPVSNQC